MQLAQLYGSRGPYFIQRRRWIFPHICDPGFTHLVSIPYVFIAPCRPLTLDERTVVITCQDTDKVKASVYY